MEEKKLIKYEITNDLRLHVWNAEDDISTTPPFYYQNQHPDGKSWESREEVEQFFINRFSAELFITE